MNLTRRDFGKLALAGLSSSALAQTAGKPNRSYINGVQFGLQPFCYHDLAMNRENRPILIQRLVQNGLGMVELHAVWYEPNFALPGVSADEARDKLRNWRLNPPAGYFRDIKKEFDDNGITICTVYINVGDSFTDAEIDATFEGAKAIGAKGIVGSYGLAVAHRLGAFPGKHGMYASLHNHDNLSDPDAFSNEASIVKGLAYSPISRRLSTFATSRRGTVTAWDFSKGITNACRLFIWEIAGRTTVAAPRLARVTRRLLRFSG